MLYNVALVSAEQQCEITIIIHISPPSLACLPSLPHPTLLGHHRAGAELSVLESTFPPAICFIHKNVYMSVLLSPFISTIKRNKFESLVVRYMNLKPIIQGEISQEEKKKYHILKLIWNLEKWY